MICSGVARELNRKIINILIEEIGEEGVFLTEFKTKREFEDYYYNYPTKSFTQIRSYLYFAGLEPIEKLNLVCVEGDEANIFKRNSEKVNNMLKEIQKKVLDESNLKSSEKDTYMSFYRIGVEIGYCHTKYYERNKAKEEEEEKREYQEHKERYKSDKGYREEYNWMNKQHRPYGGAFSSNEEMFNYIR